MPLALLVLLYRYRRALLMDYYPVGHTVVESARQNAVLVLYRYSSPITTWLTLEINLTLICKALRSFILTVMEKIELSFTLENHVLLPFPIKPVQPMTMDIECVFFVVGLIPLAIMDKVHCLCLFISGLQ